MATSLWRTSGMRTVVASSRICSNCARQTRSVSRVRRVQPSSSGVQTGTTTATTTSCEHHVHASIPPVARSYASLSHAIAQQPEVDISSFPNSATSQSNIAGPIAQYNQWVEIGRLKDDEHQRGIVQKLQDLHNALKSYTAPKIVHPKHGLESVAPPRTSMFDALFGRRPPPERKTEVPENMPQGLYLFGDVGSGKTMLMDMFYHTLPPNITSKTRIHFHHFMQDVHKRMHVMKMKHGGDFDAIPFVAADIAEASSVLCFDEFQCTDVADAMILRRLLDSLMSHGVVLVATSNRHPNDLYKNGIQRQSFLPCIALLKSRLDVINLDSPTDYRKMERPPANVYHYPLDANSEKHANKWFDYLRDPRDDPHPATHRIWGRNLHVPVASGKCAKFTFKDLCEHPLSAADYLELTKQYNAFVVTGVPQMDYKTRDLARRFITFIDAAYESRAKLVLTLETAPVALFNDKEDVKARIDDVHGGELDASMRSLMDDLGLDMKSLKNSSIFSGDEEKFAFARALSRLSEMQSLEWVERKL